MNTTVSSIAYKHLSFNARNYFLFSNEVHPKIYISSPSDYNWIGMHWLCFYYIKRHNV